MKKRARRHTATVCTGQAAFKPITYDVEVREPRCRICRDETVRVAVNELLNWRGVPVVQQDGRSHAITLTEILAQLQPLNDGREKGDRITYNSLWIHAKRHYDLAGMAAYWNTRMLTEFTDALLA